MNKNNSGLRQNGLSVLNNNNYYLNNLKTKVGDVSSFKAIADSINKTYLTSTRRSDDQAFVNNEIKNMDNKIAKRRMDRVKIWNKKDPKAADKEDKDEVNIRKRLMDIKKEIKEKDGFFENFEASKDFFGRKHLDVIENSVRIVQDKLLQANSTTYKGKNNSLQDFVLDNREISLKNFLLDLLKSEKNKIYDKERLVSEALRCSDLKFKNDFSSFKEFTEREKANQKKMEYELSVVVKANRELAEHKKRLSQENKQIMDDLDRTVKMILNLKGYASFVDTVLGGGERIIKSAENKNFDFTDLPNKEKDLEKLTESLISEFSYLEKENKDEIPELLQDPSRMDATFFDREEKILKMMESKQNFEKDKEKLIKDNNSDLREMEERLIQVKKEKVRLEKEKEKEERTIKELKKNADKDANSYELFKMIKDLYCITVFGDSFDNIPQWRRLKIKSDYELIKEFMEYLSQIEFDLIDYFNQLESISEQETLRKIVNVRKESNKYDKQRNIKKKAEEVTHKKKEKAEEKLHRVIVKGRKVMEHMPMGRHKKKVKNFKKQTKEEDEMKMIYYEQSD